jgi:hypothetical protein
MDLLDQANSAPARTSTVAPRPTTVSDAGDTEPSLKVKPVAEPAETSQGSIIPDILPDDEDDDTDTKTSDRTLQPLPTRTMTASALGTGTAADTSPGSLENAVDSCTGSTPAGSCSDNIKAAVGGGVGGGISMSSSFIFVSCMSS